MNSSKLNNSLVDCVEWENVAPLATHEAQGYPHPLMVQDHFDLRIRPHCFLDPQHLKTSSTSVADDVEFCWELE